MSHSQEQRVPGVCIEVFVSVLQPCILGALCSCLSSQAFTPKKSQTHFSSTGCTQLAGASASVLCWHFLISGLLAAYSCWLLFCVWLNASVGVDLGVDNQINFFSPASCLWNRSPFRFVSLVRNVLIFVSCGKISFCHPYVW